MNPHLHENQYQRVQAEIANERFLFALYSYGRKHGLPNLTRRECGTYLGLMTGTIRCGGWAA